MRSAVSPGRATTLTVVNDVQYCEGIPGENELRLLGDVSGGKRVLELGIAGNAAALATAGAKAIALDPDPERIADLRSAAARAGGRSSPR